jgi:hypothetical protein
MIAPKESTEKSTPVASSMKPVDIGLSYSGGATASSVRSPTARRSPTRMACTRSIGTPHHDDMRRAAKPWHTRRASGASSKTRSMAPVWSASSWVSHTHRIVAGSMTEVSASTKVSPSRPTPVSTRTGSSACRT